MCSSHLCPTIGDAHPWCSAWLWPPAASTRCPQQRWGHAEPRTSCRKMVCASIAHTRARRHMSAAMTWSRWLGRVQSGSAERKRPREGEATPWIARRRAALTSSACRSAAAHESCALRRRHESRSCRKNRTYSRRQHVVAVAPDGSGQWLLMRACSRATRDVDGADGSRGRREGRGHVADSRVYLLSARTWSTGWSRC